VLDSLPFFPCSSISVEAIARLQTPLNQILSLTLSHREPIPSPANVQAVLSRRYTILQLRFPSSSDFPCISLILSFVARYQSDSCLSIHRPPLFLESPLFFNLCWRMLFPEAGLSDFSPLYFHRIWLVDKQAEYRVPTRHARSCTPRPTLPSATRFSFPQTISHRLRDIQIGEASVVLPLPPPHPSVGFTWPTSLSHPLLAPM